MDDELDCSFKKKSKTYILSSLDAKNTYFPFKDH